MTPEDGEWHERLAFTHTCGFDSIFGDGNTVSLDLCQHCAREVLGQWLRFTPPESEREMHAIAERVITSTKEASEALDAALSSVAASNKRIAMMADDGGPAMLTQLKGVIRKPTKPVSVEEMNAVAGKKKPKKKP
jgi:NMD protein affecting ribosome stability and mRNA decay